MMEVEDANAQTKFPNLVTHVSLEAKKECTSRHIMYLVMCALIGKRDMSMHRGDAGRCWVLGCQGQSL